MTDEHTNPSMSYQDAGVDIDAADALVDDIKTIAKRTHRPEVMTGIGGFGALFEVPLDRYQQPVLVSGTDGVGTKLKLAIELKQHDTIGIDLVAMCVNDIITLGAEPLYFLDYYATGKLHPTQATSILKGIGAGCELAKCALIGGETAEMPGMYHGGDYDLAGFCVGIVEKSKIIKAENVKTGDVLIGLPSSGPHSNGYSLIRHILNTKNIPLETAFEDTTLANTLLTPTRIYVKAIEALKTNVNIHAMAHITGGGLTENLPRVMPNNTMAVINQTSWKTPTIFEWLQKEGNIKHEECFRTFNMGVGMAICVAKDDAETTLTILKDAGETPFLLGSIEPSDTSKPTVTLQ